MRDSVGFATAGLLLGVLAPAAFGASFEGKYGEVVHYPSQYVIDTEMRKSIEIIRFFPDNKGLGRSSFGKEKSYASDDLMQLLVIPKAGSSVTSIDEVRDKKEFLR